MRTCDRCQHELHWDDDGCPKCGAGLPKRRVLSAWEVESDRLTLIFRVLRFSFPPVLAVLMIAISYVVGSSVGALWVAIIAWIIIGLVALIIYRFKSTRRMKKRGIKREETEGREKLYGQFLEENPELRESSPKDRHEAFRRWLEKPR